MLLLDFNELILLIFQEPAQTIINNAKQAFACSHSAFEKEHFFSGGGGRGVEGLKGGRGGGGGLKGIISLITYNLFRLNEKAKNSFFFK